jgi:hypothetical protein
MNLKNCFLLACLIFISLQEIVSQKPGDLVKEYKSSSFDLYDLVTNGGRSSGNVSEEVSEFELMTLNNESIRNLYLESPDNFKLSLPLKKRSNINLLLVEIDMPLMEVEAAPSGKAISYRPGKHYRGIVEGQEGSWAAISVYENEIYGLISEERSESSYVLGKLKDDDTHILYNDKDLQKPKEFSCMANTSVLPQLKHEEIFSEKAASYRNTKCVRLYFEVDNDIVLNKGGETGAINYITAVYNQMAVLYSNEQINTSISKILVWTSASPYSGTSTSSLLFQFGDTRTTFDGDLAMLVAYKGNGGIAWVDGFCETDKKYSMGYSGIGSSFNNVPTYSWTVNVLAHEFGHLFGSPHTHDCYWNGNSTAIDGCAAPNSCPRPATPTNGGTIMSYCHNVSGVGINFQNGFGPQPGNLMRSRVASASCLGQCTTTLPCPDSSFPISGLSKSNQSFIAGTPFVVTATASDNGAVSKVEFWRGTTLLGTDNTSPYEYILNSTTAASFTIVARAYDNCGNQTNSTARTYTATSTCSDGVKNGTETGVDCGGSCTACPIDPCAGNIAPVSSLSKASQSFVAGTPFIVTAAASDNGTVSKVEFRRGTTLLGTDNTFPYEYTLNSTTAASYTIVARAYDNCGAQTNSASRTYTATSTCSDGVKNGTETGVDCGGSCAACSNPCVGNTAPVSSLSKANQSFVAGTLFIVTATASDNGTVSKVEFWRGTTLLGTDNTSPYEYTLNSTTAASYTIVARAYDNCGSQTNSTTRTYTATSTCSDGVKNGTETGVDCGGSCTACSNPCVGNTAPVSSLSKASQSFVAGTPFIVTAAASDNGTVSKVEFWRGTTLLGTDNTSPYAYTLNSTTAASYTIVARAYDNCGAQTNSASRTYIATSTCSDGVKNGTETGVDCGGSCASCQSGCVNGTLTLVTDNYPLETSWRITNSSNIILASGSGYSSKRTTYNVNLCLPAGSCLNFIINDAFGDGICCTQGQGSYKIVFNGQTLIYGGQFKKIETKQFCIQGTSNSFNLDQIGFNIYPNPTDNMISIQNKAISDNGEDKSEIKIEIFDNMGKVVLSQKNENSPEFRINVEHLPSGQYFVRISAAAGILDHTKLVIIR